MSGKAMTRGVRIKGRELKALIDSDASVLNTDGWKLLGF